MSPKQHARIIFSEIKEEGILKYLRGQREHGGSLWEVPIPVMVGFAKEEVIDQVSYVKTLEWQVSHLKNLCTNLFASLEEGEEPLADDDQKRVDDIKALLGVK